MRSPRSPSRRDLGRLALGGGAGLLLGGLPRALAAGPTTDRKFLFIYCVGGWDPTWALAPGLGSATVDVDPEGTTATRGGLSFVEAPSRPFVTDFFDQYADRCALLHGFEVRSVTHERCRRILMTGSSGAAADDWPAILAGRGSGYLLPDLVLSGPSYTADFGSSVVRVGASGQLASLLDGTAFLDADAPLAGQSGSSNSAVEALVRARIARAEAAALPGRAVSFQSDYADALDRLATVRELIGDVDLAPPDSDACTRVMDTVVPALTCIERGWSRAVTVQHGGFCNLGWDSHSTISMQGVHFNNLFEDLASILAELDARVGQSGLPLSEEVTVVVLSEMGRTPKLNATGGKDHWTFTSALLMGAGIAGGRVIGGYDADLIGRPVDLQTGEPDEAGVGLSSANLGATLLALADLDPAEFTSAEPIAALLA